MAVIVEGMEMPKSCDVCPFMRTNDDLMSEDYRYMYCNFPYMGHFVTDYEASRHQDCPLIEVPEPHGRLIDADKLKETIDYYISEAGWGNEINKALSWVKDEFIDSEQTVIPASKEG